MNDSRFLKVPFDLFESPLWLHPKGNPLKLYLYFLKCACYKRDTRDHYILEKGQLKISREKLAKVTNLSVQATRKAFKELVELKMITLNSLAYSSPIITVNALADNNSNKTLEPKKPIDPKQEKFYIENGKIIPNGEYNLQKELLSDLISALKEKGFTLDPNNSEIVEKLKIYLQKALKKNEITKETQGLLFLVNYISKCLKNQK